MKFKQLLIIQFIAVIFFSTGFSYTAFSQTSERLVYFKDKNGTAFSISRPLEFLTQKAIDRRNKQGISITLQDLPVNADYTSQLKNLGAVVPYTIKWFNAAIVIADDATFVKIENLSFVDKVKKVAIYSDPNRVARISATCETDNISTEEEICKEFDINETTTIQNTKENEEDFNYGNSLAQIQMLGVDRMHQLGYLGQGIHIAVLDGGFISANTLSAFSHADIAFVYDVVGNGQNVYQVSAHGTKVLSAMLSKKEGELIGTAPEATYYLFRTEDVRAGRELPIEEAFWTVGAEKADSLGVDIIQTSLGYSDFDKPEYNYTIADLDGKTAMISQAAEIASQKGIVVITSAGNSGNDPWRKISFPADAPSVLAVGAVDRFRKIADFSSRGNTADGRIKPDIVGMGVGTVLWSEHDKLTSGQGTSYAAPLVAGLVAGFMQKNPNLSQKDVIAAMRGGGDNPTTPNSDYGYGIPTFQALIGEPVLGNEDLTSKEAQIRIFPNPVANNLNIEIDEKLFISNPTLKFQIYNLQGKLIVEEILKSNKKEIEFPSVPKGTYIVRIEGQNYQGTIKMLKD